MDGESLDHPPGHDPGETRRDDRRREDDHDGAGAGDRMPGEDVEEFVEHQRSVSPNSSR
jgi:hypothetical protein